MIVEPICVYGKTLLFRVDFRTIEMLISTFTLKAIFSQIAVVNCNLLLIKWRFQVNHHLEDKLC